MNSSHKSTTVVLFLPSNLCFWRCFLANRFYFSNLWWVESFWRNVMENIVDVFPFMLQEQFNLIRYWFAHDSIFINVDFFVWFFWFNLPRKKNWAHLNKKQACGMKFESWFFLEITFVCGILFHALLNLYTFNMILSKALYPKRLFVIDW